MVSFLSFSAYAKINAENALNSPAGSLLAHIGLGVAANGDATIVDINPALVTAIEKQYSAFGNLNFNSGFDLFEVGIMDTIFSPVQAVFKARQTTVYTSEVDRRFELALGYRIPSTGLGIGVIGEYEQHHVTNWTHAKSDSAGLGVGALYQLNFQPFQPLFLGASVMNLLNKFQKTTYNIGISKQFAKDLLLVHADGAMANLKNKPEIAGGIDLTFRKYFIVMASVGYDFDKRVAPLGGGIYFNGPRLKVFYSLASHQANSDSIWHSTGMYITF